MNWVCARKSAKKNTRDQISYFDQIENHEYRYLTYDRGRSAWLVPNICGLRILTNFGEKPRCQNGGGDSLGLTTAQVNLLSAQGGDGVWVGRC